MLSSKRNYQAAYRFLKNALKKTRVNERPLKITIDKHPFYDSFSRDQALKSHHKLCSSFYSSVI
ncbi:hypothetical protein IM40_08275 [Candidatus Paracaedimonas acanthamoebae]|nr:hypothetical protein IM40_08275 [Candidatus Paracaedimonas acanthamoebae]